MPSTQSAENRIRSVDSIQADHQGYAIGGG